MTVKNVFHTQVPILSLTTHNHHNHRRRTAQVNLTYVSISIVVDECME